MRKHDLKKAIGEIAKICKKYQVGGFISLVSPERGEFLTIMPVWSGLQIEDGGFRLRLSSKEPEKAAATAHLILGLRDMSGLNYQNMEAMANELKKKMEIEHTPFGDMGINPPPPNLGMSSYWAVDYKKNGEATYNADQKDQDNN